MARITLRGTGDIEQITVDMIEMLEKVGKSCELIGASSRGSNVMIVFEKYYFRSNSTASLSIMLTEKDGSIYADVMGSGGGTGIFNVSWDAEENFVGSAKSVLLGMGFVEL